MAKIYYLKNCSTCKRIIDELGAHSSIELQNIREDKITEDQLDEMAKIAGSYEKLFSRRAMKYKSMGLAEKDLKESDYKSLILAEDTFLKRPVIVTNDKIFVGSAKKEIEAAKEAMK